MLERCAPSVICACMLAEQGIGAGAAAGCCERRCHAGALCGELRSPIGRSGAGLPMSWRRRAAVRRAMSPRRAALTRPLAAPRSRRASPRGARVPIQQPYLSTARWSRQAASDGVRRSSARGRRESCCCQRRSIAELGIEASGSTAQEQSTDADMAKQRLRPRRSTHGSAAQQFLSVRRSG
jgi:hypothetical protein